MESVLGHLSPQLVFKHFEAISKIPRESGNEQGISDYLIQFAHSLGLEAIQEPSLNVIIHKPASTGYENAPTVILQGHMDMVCVKNETLVFDFAKDPIPLIVEDDFVKTKGTTLGADNGIAVAMIMSIFEDHTLKHPPLTALITVAEETGMDGVVNLNPENIKGDILINIDSEEEGTLLASCAGGVNNIVRYPIESVPATFSAGYTLTVKGLLGGHSGIEIDKNRGNAIILLGRVLQAINMELPFELASIDGGEKMNAIAKQAQAKIAIDPSHLETLTQTIFQQQYLFKNEFQLSDPNIEIALKSVDAPQAVITTANKDHIINLLRLIPNGVQTMSSGIFGLVESSNNIGVLKTHKDHVVFTSAIRSSVKSLKDEINHRIQSLCHLTGATMELVADYPQWAYTPQSFIRDLMQSVYLNLYRQELKVDAIHAGLECGFLKEKIGDIDMISLGPNLFDVHTPNEKLSISSTERVYTFLCSVLEKIK